MNLFTSKYTMERIYDDLLFVIIRKTNIKKMCYKLALVSKQWNKVINENKMVLMMDILVEPEPILTSLCEIIMYKVTKFINSRSYVDNIYNLGMTNKIMYSYLQKYKNNLAHKIIFDGKRCYCHGNLIHRDNDKPAIIWPDRSQEWYFHGYRHRDNDKPAIIWAYGVQEWYQHGKQHRDGDLPAVIWADGQQEWYQHGKRHRDSGLPAIIYADGTQEWYQRGRRQSDRNVPAAFWSNGTEEWRKQYHG